MRRLIVALLAGVVAAAGLRVDAQRRPAAFSIVEATIAEMRTAMEQGRTTSHEIVQQSLTRIALYEERLNAVIAVNPHALEEADARDRERRQGHVRGPLHGIPIALKDNIHTTGMPTTGGALAFAGLVAPYEATLTRHLRDAGAIVVAKTVMTELANWVGAGMPTNYSALGGYGRNPYDPRIDPRPASDGRPVLAPGGSSSGIGTAASLWAANVGTETSGSILNPASQTMLVGIKPTVGRISRYGVIPITADQDTPGPMTRTVADAAALLGILEGDPDEHDPATRTCRAPTGHDYTRFLKRDALNGARIGIPRAGVVDAIAVPGSGTREGGISEAQRGVLNQAIDVLRANGAVILDPADLPSFTATTREDNLLAHSVCGGPQGGRDRDQNCSIVFKYGMKRDFNAWLASLGAAAPVKTLTELREWNLAHQRAGALKYGQSQLDISDEMDVDRDRARYLADRATDVRLSAAEGIDAALKANRLDALLFAGPSGAAIAAKPGYPTVIVPFGLIPNAPSPPLPPGFNAKPAPYGISFTGTACSEPTLIGIAYAFEQATKRRVAPRLEP